MKLKLKLLETLTRENIGRMKEMVSFNETETEYWINMIERMTTQCKEDDYLGIIDFYKKELESTKNMFGDRVAVERRLKYWLGYEHEWLGTHGMKEHPPLERAGMLVKAVGWYQSADETIGFFTDYSLRQAESSGMAAKFRLRAGLDDEVTEAFAQWSNILFSTYARGLTGGEPILVSGSMAEILKHVAKKDFEDVVTRYTLKINPLLN